MKYLIIIMVSSLSLFSCIKTPQKRELTFEQQQERIRLDSLYLLYDSMPPRFDIKTFNKQKGNKDSYGIHEGDSIYIRYSIRNNEILIDRNILESYLTERSIYDSLGILKRKYTLFYNSILYGDYFEYNEDGKLINVISKNNHFAFTSYDLIDFANSMNIQKSQMSCGIHYDTIINQYSWFLKEQVKPEGLVRIFYLDTETGELIDYIEFDNRDTKYWVWKMHNIIIEDE